MSFIKDTFFGGAEKKAGRALGKAAREAGGIRAESIREAAPIRAAAERAAGRTLERAGQASTRLIRREFGETAEGLQPFIDPGQQAAQQQAALSGALGPEAQAQAFADFQGDPGTQFLREEGLRLIGSGAGATGGVGGGERLRELTRFSQGLALQDLSNRFSRLGSVTGTGLQAAGSLGQLRGQASAGQAQGLQFAGRGRATGISSAGAAEAAGLVGAGEAEALGLTGGVTAEQEGRLAGAAGFRGGVGQVAGAIIGGQTGGFTGALEGGFGV